MWSLTVKITITHFVSCIKLGFTFSRRSCARADTGFWKWEGGRGATIFKYKVTVVTQCARRRLGVRGHAPRECFCNINALSCILRYFDTIVSDTNDLEKLQTEAGIIVTGATKSSYSNLLSPETGINQQHFLRTSHNTHPPKTRKKHLSRIFHTNSHPSMEHTSRTLGLYHI